MFFSTSDPTTLDASVASSVFQTLSHLVFVPIVALFSYLGLYYATSVAAVLLASSTVYHVCRADWFCFGLGATSAWSPALNATVYAGLERARLLDHIVANAAPAAVLVMVVLGDSGGGAAGAVVRASLPVFSTFAVLAFPFQLQAPVLVLTFVTVALADVLLRQRAFDLPMHERFALLPLALGAACGLAGIALYTMGDAAYPVAHPLWHVLIALALFFVAVGSNVRRTRHHWSWRCATFERCRRGRGRSAPP